MTRTRTDSPATDFALALLAEFVGLGVRDIVVCPGSRSQALALAAAHFERLGLVRLRVRIDERVAGFVALGSSIETGRPTLVITTSGTAVANLHPAVLEAHHSGVPIVVLSADRPPGLRGIRSNQTTDQPGMFGSAVSRVWDVAAPVGDDGEADAAVRLAREVIGVASGPLHVNLSFSEPLSAAIPEAWAPPERDSVSEDLVPSAAPLVLHPEPGTIVVAGSGSGPVAEEVARQLGAPLIAEVASGAHFGPNLVVAYRGVLAESAFAAEVERIVVFGHPTLSREVPALIQRDGMRTVVARSAGADDYNPGHRVDTFADAVVVEGDPPPSARDWVGRWVARSRELVGSADVPPDPRAGAAEHARSELAAVRTPVTRRSLVEAVWRASWPHDRLVLGASRLIRVLDQVATGKRISVHANRGLAGIDGTISTSIGMALASQADGAPGTTRVLLGDLALLHDAGALAFGVGEQRPRIQVIVGDDGGGTIFDGLEVASSAGEAFDRVMLTRQAVDVEALAAAYGWRYLRVDIRGELDAALSASVEPTIVHVPLAR